VTKADRAAFFGDEAWPWVTPEDPDDPVGVLPARARFERDDGLTGMSAITMVGRARRAVSVLSVGLLVAGCTGRPDSAASTSAPDESTTTLRPDTTAPGTGAVLPILPDIVAPD
jgi:hypothetical protein